MAETIDGLKERRAWLLRQVELTDRAVEKLLTKSPRKPTPQELPGIPPAPPREKSDELKAYDYFEARRRGRLERMGFAYVPEPKLVSAAWITVVFSAASAALGDEPERVAELINLYFELEWPAKYDVPYNFGAFAKVWREQLLTKLEPRAA